MTGRAGGLSGSPGLSGPGTTTLLLVHAHPDDESILTGGVMARAHIDGHRVVLITATRGERGELGELERPLDPASSAGRGRSGTWPAGDI